MLPGYGYLVRLLYNLGAWLGSVTHGYCLLEYWSLGYGYWKIAHPSRPWTLGYAYWVLGEGYSVNHGDCSLPLEPQLSDYSIAWARLQITGYSVTPNRTGYRILGYPCRLPGNRLR